MKKIILVFAAVLIVIISTSPVYAGSPFSINFGYTSVAWRSDLGLLYTLPSTRAGFDLDMGKVDLFLDRIDTQKREKEHNIYGDVGFNFSRTDVGLKYKIPVLPLKARLVYRDYFLNTTSNTYNSSGHYSGLGIGADTKIPATPIDINASYFPSLNGPDRKLNDFEIGATYNFSMKGLLSGRLSISHDSIGNTAGNNMDATIFYIGLTKNF